MRKAFSLVEIMIAVVVASGMIMFVMQMLSQANKMAGEGTELMNVARQASTVLRKMKLSIREAQDVQVGEGSLICIMANQKQQRFWYKPDPTWRKNGIEFTDEKGKHLYGKGNVIKFTVTALPGKLGNIYRISLLFRNPQSRTKPSEETVREFGCLVSQRVHANFSDPSWVDNGVESCPPNCN